MTMKQTLIFGVFLLLAAVAHAVTMKIAPSPIFTGELVNVTLCEKPVQGPG